MAGMDKMMAALMAMNGAEFERGWLPMMLHHHQGAVDMSALAERRTTHTAMLQLANGIIAAQTKEIEQMRDWAMAWYGFDPMPAGHGGHGSSPMPGLPNTGSGGGGQDMSARPIIAALLLALAILPVGVLLRRAGRASR